MAQDVNNIQINEDSPEHKRIAWWLENAVIRAIKRVLNDTKDFFRQLFTKSVESSIDSLEESLIPFIRPYAEQILAIKDIPEAIKQPIREALTGKSQAGIIIIASVVYAFAQLLHEVVSPAINRKIQMKVESVFRTALFTPELLITLRNRRIISEEQCNEFLGYNGVSNEGISALKRLSVPLFDDGTLSQLYWRKEMPIQEVRIELAKRGMTDSQIDYWIKLRNVIPSPSDLVSIAVREGFNDNVAKTFGYDENFPTEAAEWAEKGGFSPYFFKALWRAHWNLPGLIQVREMFHRGIITDSDVDTYLLAADYPIFWRKAIKEWMYNIVTRVDARRMYDLGIWSIERVFKHNLELGYNPQDAKDQTEWIALSYAEEERDLTKTDILGMYMDGILDYNEADGMLEDLDFNEAARSLMLAHQDLKRSEKYERTIIANVEDLYVAGQYDRTDVLTELGKINTPPDVIRQNLAIWDLQKERKTVRPTVTQLRDMRENGVIDRNTWRNEMSNRQYGEKYIDWYEKMWFKGD